MNLNIESTFASSGVGAKALTGKTAVKLRGWPSLSKSGVQGLALLLLIPMCLAIGSQPLAADHPAAEYEIERVRETFAALQRAYATEDVHLFLGCHEPLLPQFDRPRDEMIIMRKEVAREQITQLFAWLDGMKLEFLNLDIAVDGDVAVARTLRRATAAGQPDAIYCRMAFTLNKGYGGWGSQRWRFANYTIYDEWTELAAEPQSNASIQSLAPAPKPGGQRYPMFF